MTQINRIFDLLPYIKEKYEPLEDVLAGKENGKWVKYSIDQYQDIANKISYGLIKLGVKKGDKIATISNNRPEWNFLDMAILQIGAIHVPIYPTISESDYQYILNHAEVSYVFVAGMDLLRKIEHILPEIDSLKGIYTFRDIDNAPHLNDLIEIGEKNQNPELLEKLKNNIASDDTCTLIYTSGTTGNPKGVMLSHYSIICNFKGVSHIPPIQPGDKSMSYLPLCHIYERMMNLMFQYNGNPVYYAENIAKIVDNLKEIKPKAMTSVPRLLEKIYDKIIMQGRKQKGLKRAIFFWAINLGLKYEYDGENGAWYNLKLKIADKLVFKRWREAMGGQMEVIVSGGAAIQPRLARIYTAAGIPIVPGYGLSETSPVIAVSHFGKDGRMFGTVGHVLEGLDVKIADDGEILVKGHCVMKGYYKAPDLTKEAIDKDGYFHTGDVGIIEEKGQLRITGRKKEIFKTSNGKYISPVLLENKLKESPFIDSLVVLGENQKFAAALITPDFEHLKSWCRHKKIDYTNNSDMVTNKSIKARFKKEIDHYNKFFGATEKINRFELLDNEWSVQSGELTPNLKVKRDFIMQKYKPLVEKLFS
ncbi:MAG: long-chain fatty acid--CoA ligase [Hyphomicrobiales bacterium]